MSTILHQITEKLIELQKRLEELREEIEEEASCLDGAEINHPDYSYCVIDGLNFDKSVSIYYRDQYGCYCFDNISLEELLKYV
jgi:hypothetical protein